MMRGEPDTMTSPKQMLTLWIHEMMRVFQDRLCVPKDKDWFQVGRPTLVVRAVVTIGVAGDYRVTIECARGTARSFPF